VATQALVAGQLGVDGIGAGRAGKGQAYRQYEQQGGEGPGAGVRQAHVTSFSLLSAPSVEGARSIMSQKNGNIAGWTILMQLADKYDPGQN
jgi:hypothetical protein